MLFFYKLVQETQMSTPPEATRCHNLTKLLILLPLRDNSKSTFQCETPCTFHRFNTKKVTGLKSNFSFGNKAPEKLEDLRKMRTDHQFEVALKKMNQYKFNRLLPKVQPSCSLGDFFSS